MLIFTKDEIKCRISCIKQMMDALNVKMNYFESLLQGLECTTSEKHCLIINVSFQDVPMDAFMDCDTIEVLSNPDTCFHDQNKNFNNSPTPKKNTKIKRNKKSRDLNPVHSKESSDILVIKQENITTTNNFDELSDMNLENVVNNETQHEELQLSISISNVNNDLGFHEDSFPDDNNQQVAKHRNQFISQTSEDHSFMNFENNCSILSSLMFNESVENINCTSSYKHKSSPILKNIPIKPKNVVPNSLIFSQSNDVFPSINSLDIMPNLHVNNNPDDLRVATRIHQNSNIKIKSYSCCQCNAKFNNLSNRNRHVRLKHEHLNNRPFQCQLCMKSFKLHHHLKEHFQRCINRCDHYGY